MLRKKYKKDICIYIDINQENNTGSRKILIFYLFWLRTKIHICSLLTLKADNAPSFEKIN